MNRWSCMGHGLWLTGLALCLASAAAQAQTAVSSVDALVYSTMPSTSAHRPEMALDGDDKTYFRSVYGMEDGDTFIVLLSQSAPVRSIKVVTGDAEGHDAARGAVLSTSTDGEHFSRAASFDDSGKVDAQLNGAAVRAIRVGLTPRRGLAALVIREITVDSPTKIGSVLLGPGRGFVDVSQAPDLQGWADKAEKQMESFWADTAALLYTDGFITPNMVNVIYRPKGPGVTDIAATGGGVMTINIGYCRNNPDDTALTVHETAHAIQCIPSYDPIWLVEGIADYIRWVKYEPEHFRVRISPTRSTYHDSYQTSGAFLAWCELHYDSRLVTKLNQDVRFGRFKIERFKQYCGKDVDTLWKEFVADYQADPAHVLTPPVPAADKPRTLPAVTAGSSVGVNLRTSANTNGIVPDGTASDPNGGFDGGGYSYSGTLLGTSQKWHDVTFNLLGASGKNVVTAAGQVIPLTSGHYGSIWLLGTGVEGNQREQTFVVTYADGKTDTFSQNMSDWYVPQNYPGEERAVTMRYRLLPDGSKDPRTFNLYGYGFALDANREVKSLTLPNNPYVKIVAVSLAK